jgi:hypothetical protein
MTSSVRVAITLPIFVSKITIALQEDSISTIDPWLAFPDAIPY